MTFCMWEIRQSYRISWEVDQNFGRNSCIREGRVCYLSFFFNFYSFFSILQDYELCEEWRHLYPIPREDLINLHREHLLHLLETGNMEKALQVIVRFFQPYVFRSGNLRTGFFAFFMCIFLAFMVPPLRDAICLNMLSGASLSPVCLSENLACQSGCWT